MSKELLAKLKWKRKVYRTREEGQATWEAYRNSVTACRDATMKAKAHLDFNLAMGVKDNKKGFLKYINSKRKTGKMWGHC